MNRETIFGLLLIFISFLSAAGYYIPIGGSDSNSLGVNGYYDDEVNLMAGRTYFIGTYGTNGFNTTLTVTDPSGYQVFNDDYEGWNGTAYNLSAGLNFTPTTSGRTVIRNRAGSGSGYVYTSVVDITPCSASCTSKCFSLLPRLSFEGCANVTISTSYCPGCPKGFKCNSCPSGQYSFGSMCTTNCPERTLGLNSVCQGKKNY